MTGKRLFEAHETRSSQTETTESFQEAGAAHQLKQTLQGAPHAAQLKQLQPALSPWATAGVVQAKAGAPGGGGGGGGRTGLPASLKAGTEALSGMDMSDVTVHHNSSKPAQMKALAYAQGSDIHLGPGQEKHLPHEAWHVVQQKQGRVTPTIQAKGLPINDDAGLEHEADVMGDRASQLGGREAGASSLHSASIASGSQAPIQGRFDGALKSKTTGWIHQKLIEKNPDAKLAKWKVDGLLGNSKVFTTLAQVAEHFGLDAPDEEAEEIVVVEDKGVEEDVGVEDKGVEDKIQVEEKSREEDLGMEEEVVAGSSSYTPPSSGVGDLVLDDIASVVSDPVTGAPVFASSPEYLPATFKGVPVRLKAGQDYLNTECSSNYKEHPEAIKGSAAKLAKPPANKDYPEDVFVVTDGHHRLVWGGFHGQTVPANLKKFGSSAPLEWGGMTYKATPEKMAIKPLEESEVAEWSQKALVGFVSPEKSYFTRMGAGKKIQPFVLAHLEALKKTADEGQVHRIVHYIGTQVSKAPFIFYDFVAWLGSQTEGCEGVVETLMQTNDFPCGAPPSVVMGRTQKGTGEINQTANVIVLDEVGNDSPKAMLDTLLFETQNGRNLAELREARTKGNAPLLTSQIEFNSTEKYVEALMQANKASSFGELCLSLGVGKGLLVPHDNPMEPVEIDDSLTQKDQRTALWFFKTQGWDRKQQMDVFLGTGHTKDSKSTVEEYGQGKKLDLFI